MKLIIAALFITIMAASQKAASTNQLADTTKKETIRPIPVQEKVLTAEVQKP